jgi:hypothetical protein
VAANANANANANAKLRTRPAVLCVVITAGLLGIAAACTSLDGLSGAGDSVDGSSTPLDGESDGRSGAVTDGGSDASAAQDGPLSPEAAAACASCDCDLDVYPNDDAGCAATTAEIDCDDTNPSIHPSASSSTSPWTSKHTPEGDWDCDGLVTKTYKVNVSCTGSALGGCDSLAGFSGNPDCGAPADYVSCKTGPLGTSCVTGSTATKTQGCK